MDNITPVLNMNSNLVEDILSAASSLTRDQSRALRAKSIAWAKNFSDTDTAMRDSFAGSVEASVMLCLLPDLRENLEPFDSENDQNPTAAEKKTLFDMYIFFCPPTHTF